MGLRGPGVTGDTAGFSADGAAVARPARNPADSSLRAFFAPMPLTRSARLSKDSYGPARVRSFTMSAAVLGPRPASVCSSLALA